MLIGALAALASAALWATTNLLVKMEARNLSVVAINCYRTLIGAAVMVTVFLVTCQPAAVLSVPLAAVVALLASVALGLVVGDTLMFRAMQSIGLGRAFPIAGSYPLFTLLLATLILGEPVGWREALGGLITLTGVTLVALPAKAALEVTLDRRTQMGGVAMALCAASLWAGSSIVVKVGLTDIDVVTASAIRLPAAALLLWLLLLRGERQPALWRLRGRTLGIVLAAGVLGSSLSGSLWLFGVQEIGVARSAILSSTSPIFAVPLSLLVLKERLVPRVLAGTLLSVAGIILIVA